MSVIEIALNPTFEYINKVITDWHERNLKSSAEVQAFLEQRKKQEKSAKDLKANISKRTYEQRNYDNLDFLYANQTNKED